MLYDNDSTVPFGLFTQMPFPKQHTETMWNFYNIIYREKETETNRKRKQGVEKRLVQQRESEMQEWRELFM